MPKTKDTPEQKAPWLPQAIDAATRIFPANVSHLMPAYQDIPDEFKHGNAKWNRFQSEWFYGGINAAGLKAKDGIDKAVALRHLGAIQGSFEPKHEHKQAAVAYLASLWFDPSSTWTKAETK